MTIIPAKRLQGIKPSATLKLAARAKQLQAEGKDIINLSVGEPDFDTPEHIKEAAREALRRGLTKYTPVDGTPALKQAVAKKFQQENQLHYTPQQIIVCHGDKHCFYNLTQALLNPGDEVIIPAPYWVSYPEIVKMAHAVPIILPTSLAQQFKISAAQLQAAITPKTRLVVINSPSNPSGMAYTPQELVALGEVLLKYPDIVIATDDMYEHFIWNQPKFCNIVNACPQLYERTAVMNGVSKTYAMTGWRIGYTAGPQELIAAMVIAQSQSTSNPNSIAQFAAQAALESDQQCVRDMCKAYKERHDFVYQQLQQMQGVDVLPSDGTFYSFFDTTAFLAKHTEFKDDTELAEHLINETGVVLVPGIEFGAKNHIRLSFAADMAQLQQGLSRLQKVFGKRAY